MTELKEVVVTPAVEIQVTFGPDGGRGFGVRFAPLPLDQARTDLDEVMDKVLDAIERQRARFLIADKEAQLAQLVAIIRKTEGSLISTEEQARMRWESEGRKGDWSPDRLPASEAMKKSNTEVGLKRDRATAEALDEEIKKLRHLVNGHGAHVGSDRHAGMSDR
jgi:hypothetical protein